MVVMAVNPYAPKSEKVLISLCMPAPEDGSEPPTLRIFIMIGLQTTV